MRTFLRRWFYGGMRNIKTAISVMLCIIISNLLNLNNPLFVIIGAIVSMQGSINESYQNGINRILGTIFGAVIGIMFFQISPHNILLIGLGTVFIIYFNNRLKMNKSIVISLIVFCSIMLNADGNVFLYSSFRVIDTTVGIIVAFVVNILIFRPSHKEKINIILNEMIGYLDTQLYEYFKDDISFEINEYNQRLSTLKQVFEVYKSELLIMDKNYEEEEKLIKCIMLLEEIHHNIQTIVSFDKQISKSSAELIKKQFNINIETIIYSEDDLFMVYNYHIKNIIFDLIKLKQFQGYNL